MILSSFLVRCQMIQPTGCHVDDEKILVEIRFIVADEQLLVVQRPAVRRVVAAWAFGEGASGGRKPLDFAIRELTLPARLDFLYVDVESIRLLAVSGEGDAFAIMAPAAEQVDGVWMVRQVLAHPAVADAVV